VRLVVVLVATTLAAWIASMASVRVLSSYARRFGFFVVMGLWLAVFSDLPRHDIGAHPWPLGGGTRGLRPGSVGAGRSRDGLAAATGPGSRRLRARRLASESSIQRPVTPAAKRSPWEGP
jgi:hypothetical protein